MSFEVPSHDTLLARILLDYSNQRDKDGNTIDTSKGTLTYIDCIVLASVIQGVYYRLKYTEQQILANLGGAKTATINQWASLLGIPRETNDTDADVVLKIAEHFQKPATGGNENDWINWAKDISVDHVNSDSTSWTEDVIDADTVENIRRPGSVDLYLLSEWTTFPDYSDTLAYQTGDYIKYKPVNGVYRIYKCLTNHSGQIPDPSGSTSYWELLGGCTSEAVTAAETDIEENHRVLGLWDNQYYAATITALDFTAELTGDITESEAVLIIQVCIADNKISQLCSLAEIIALLWESGAETVDITIPSDDVPASGGEKFVAGDLQITVI